MELRHLQYFVAVAEELNFRRAAKRLGVSAPALSVQVKKLEIMLGVRLCERNTARVTLTVPGEMLLREARELLQRAQDLVGATKDAAQGKCGVLRIGIPGASSLEFLPGVLRDYHERFPEVDIRLMEFSTEGELSGAIEDGRVHVGFVCGGALQCLDDAGHFPVMDSPVRVVMRARHPLTFHEQISLDDLAVYPFFCSRQFEGHCQQMIAALRKKRIKPLSINKVDGLSACMTMLAAGDGVTLLSSMCAMPLADKLVCRSLKETPVEFRLQIYAAWKSDAATPQTANFVDLLRQAVAQNPAQKD